MGENSLKALKIGHPAEDWAGNEFQSGLGDVLGGQIRPQVNKYMHVSLLITEHSNPSHSQSLTPPLLPRRPHR